MGTVRSHTNPSRYIWQNEHFVSKISLQGFKALQTAAAAAGLSQVSASEGFAQLKLPGYGTYCHDSTLGYQHLYTLCVSVCVGVRTEV